jgi:very-short-patch-repair endonuclease
VAESSLDTTRRFTRAQGLAAGRDPARARVGEFKRILFGVYVDANVEVTPSVRALAALTLFDSSAFASHFSAARVHGVPVPTHADEHVTVTEHRHRRRPRGVVPHVNPRPEVTVVGGVRVSTPTQMFIELAPLLSLVDLVVVGDHIVRQAKVSLRQLSLACEQSNDRGARAARRAAGYVRERVDSPMETRLRMLIVLAGLPEPKVNLTLRDVDGQPVRRYDLCWPTVRVIVEYDGRQHIEREQAWESDLERREAIDDDGWRILVVTSRGIYREPERTVLRVWRLLRARRLRGVPSRPSEAWRPHFPGP